MAAAGLCVQCVNDIHITKIQSADAEYCFDFNDWQPILILTEENSGLELRTTNDSIECKSFSYLVKTIIDFVDESGDSIVSFHGGYLTGTGVFGGAPIDIELLPSVISAEYPSIMRPWFIEERRKDTVLKELSQIKNKFIDGYMTVSPKCKNDFDTTYNFNFRAKITGECTADFLKKYDRSQRR